MCAGRPSSASATALFVSSIASETGLPFIISVAMELDAIALPQPKVSNFDVADDSAVYFQIDLHDVAALGVADFPDAVRVFDNAHVPRMTEMIHNGFAVKSHSFHLTE